MDSILEALLHRTGPDPAGSHPLIFRLPADREKLTKVLEHTPGIEVNDRIEAQLRELIKSLNPSQRLTEELLQEKITTHLNGSALKDYGAWVFYPWSKRLVHLLDEEEFAIVRTDRNRNKITRDEQLRLSKLKVGVIGLSVGQSVSLTMALERGFGEIRLADFDTLDLSNLNRIRTGTHNLGVNKVLITAREIAEVDPYLKVTCFTEGLTKENMDAFFTEGGNLDILVEECDSVDIKILARQKAKALRIPVVMDTSDRGMMDIERFDLEPDRSILHGLIDHLDPDGAAAARTNEDKLPYLVPMVGMETISKRLKASMLEIGQTINTWPQLSSNVALGGALTADVCRRLALGQFTASGRWFVDVEDLISNTVPSAINSSTDRFPPIVQGGSSPTIGDMLEKAVSAIHEYNPPPPLSESTILKLVEAGALAPSAGNSQPWKFLSHNGRLFLFHDHSRSVSALDPDHFIDHIGLGACIENILQRASSMGIALGHKVLPIPNDETLVAYFEATTAPVVESLLAIEIPRRHTNRKKGSAEPMEEGQMNRLISAAGNANGLRTHTIQGKEILAAIGSICGAAERLRVKNIYGHADFFATEMRWSAEEAKRTRDGLDINTMELNMVEQVGLRAASDPAAMDLLRTWKGGKGFETGARRNLAASSGVVLFTMPGTSPMNVLTAGRAIQRTWLQASAMNLATHPVSAAIFLGHHARSAFKSALTEIEKEEALELFADLKSAFDLSKNEEPIFLLNISRAGSASTRSIRLPAEHILLKTSIAHG